MDTTAEAVDELFRVTYKGITYTFRLAEELLAGGGKLVAGAAHGGAALAGIFAALKHQEYRTKGAVKFENLLQRGKGFAQFDIMEKDYGKFQQAAKDCGVLYACVTMDKVNAPGERVFTIFCGRDQAEIVNHIIEVNHLTVVQSKDYRQESAREATPQEIHSMTEDEIRSRNRAGNADFMAEFMDRQQGREEAVNPTVLPVNVVPSVSVSANTDGRRESVRARIKRIRLQQGHVALPLPEHASPTKDDMLLTFRPQTVTISENKKVYPATAEDDVVRGGLSVEKRDTITGATPQGDADFSGIQFEIINKSRNPVIVNDKSFAPDEVVLTLTTDSQGKASTANDALPFGEYLLHESATNESMLNTAPDQPVIVSEHHEVYSFVAENEVVRGGVLIEKRDLESGLLTPLGGASLDGTLFEITNKSRNAVYVDGALYEPESVCLTIEVKDGIAQSDARALPYGTYTLVESKPGTGYLWTDKKVRDFTVRKDGEVTEFREGDAAYNQVKRGDLRFVKVGEDNMHRFANVLFKLTSQTTGESHILVTDENGEVRTETAWNPHSQNTNGNDDTEETDNLAGTWFGLTTEDWMVETQDGLCALPFDHYTLEELRCPGNEGYELVTVPDISITRDSTVIELGTIDDKFEGNPEIGTTATIGGEKVADPLAEVTLVDTVSYTGLTVGKTYKLSGVLIDKSTGEPLEIGGQQVTAEKEFTPKSEAGTVDLEYTFDASALAGRAVVVFETLYQDGSEVASHADIEDEGQTITFRNPKIGTTATVDGEKTADPLGKVTIVDIVTYTGLTPGKTYKLSGTLMDKSTKEKLLVDGKEITAEATFTASKAEGSIDIPFTFDASSLAGKSVVVFETLYRDDMELAVHADIDDEGQTVDFGKPDIKTTATIDGNKVTDPLGEVTIIDTVEYTGLTVGKTYNVTGVLMDKSTNEKLLVDGKEITSSAEFTAEKENGTVEVSFTFDCSGLAGKSIVVFETLYQDGLELAVHADIEDEAQTVTVNAKGGLLIKKTAEDNMVEGISFLVTGKDYAETFKTDAQGEIYIQDLPLGEYTITEVENDTTSRYVIENGKTVTVENGSEPAVVEFHNKLKRGSLRIVKVETGTDTRLEGASFCLKDADGQVVADGKTDKNGELVFDNLPWGKYFLEEIYAPEGYILDNKETEIEIGEDSIEAKITVENKKKTPDIPTTSVPKTGDTRANPWFVGLAMAGMLAGAGGLTAYLVKKRRK